VINSKRIAILRALYKKLNEMTPSSFDPSFNIRSYSDSALEDLFLTMENDKLTLAQVAHNSELSRALSDQIKLGLVEALRYERLKNVNSEIYKTINFEILSLYLKKYILKRRL